MVFIDQIGYASAVRLYLVNYLNVFKNQFMFRQIQLNLNTLICGHQYSHGVINFSI
jgi:hypothetical protein